MVAWLIVLGCLGLYATVIGGGSVWMAMRRRLPSVERPAVSVLVPLRGFEAGLEGNIDSYLKLCWQGELQILFGASDPDDAGLDIAARIISHYPEVDVELVRSAEPLGRNPRLNVLEAMRARAKYGVVIVADSNTRADEGFLDAMLAPFDEHEVGMVVAAMAGTGENSLLAGLENLQLCTIGAAAIFAQAVLGWPPLLSKSFAIRTSVLDPIGGFPAFRNVLAEDQELARAVRRAGHRIALATRAVRVFNADRSLTQFTDRHGRWAKIRFQAAPWLYPLELAAAVTPLAVLLAILGASGWLPLVAYAGRISIDGLAAWSLRGQLPSPLHLLLVPLKSFVTLGLWFVPFASNEVTWRGARLRVVRHTRLLSDEAWERRRAIEGAQPREPNGGHEAGAA